MISNPSARLPESLRGDAVRCGRRMAYDRGRHVLRPGAQVDTFDLVERGALRVFTAGGDGRELTLYTVQPGQCCLLNLLCLVTGQRSPAHVVADAPVTGVSVPRATVMAWIAERDDVRRFVFEGLADRVASMMSLVQDVAFQRLDCRLATYLVQRADRDGELALTHEAVAAELGTKREVVSRLLKMFERRGVLTLRRGTIVVKDRRFLREYGC